MITTLPAVLTAADWNKKKGTIAKMAGETGIGAALTKLDAAWKRIAWDDLDPNKASYKLGGKVTVQGLQTLLPAAKKAAPTVEPARKELVAVRNLAESVAATWKKNPVIPSSSRKHLEDMAKQADQLFVALKSIDNDWKVFADGIRKEDARMQQMAMQVMKPYFTSLRTYASEIAKEPTVAKYTGSGQKGFHQNVRGMNAALERSKNEAWIAWKDKNWKPLSQAGYLPKSDAEVIPKVREVLTKLKELEQLVS